MAKTVPARPVFGTLNEHLICTLCKGYLVDSTTIVECLHSFCRSCIVQYLQASSFCPTCEVQLHKGSPLRSLKPDKTLQDIVFKLVPNLFHSEMQRRRVYYDAHPQYVDQTTPEQRGDCLERFYSPDDSISLSLEYHDRRKSIGRESSGDQKVLPPKRYLKCPALFTVGLLKKFVRYKFDLPQEIVIDIFQRRESLADEYTLLDIAYIYPWKRSEPMKFFYSVRDPRIPESDEEVEREMPSLSAAVSGRATRASRRASSASSLASPRASPRASPVPSGRRATESPPPAKLTTRPPSGATQPKAVSGTPTSPKITLTISPSRGTVTASTGEPVSPDDAPQPVRSPPPVTKPVGKISTTAASKPVTVVPSKPATPVVGKSVTNALSKPVAPVESKPLTAVPSKPAAPVVCRPATPAIGKPTAPIPSKPVATTAGKPSASVENKATTHVLTKVVAPLAGKTATLVTSKTATPVTSKPSVSVTNQATTPTGSKAVVNRGAASTPLAVPNKRNGTPNGMTPAAAPPPKIGAVPHTPQATAFPATVTTKTLNGGFVTVKNPVGRPANGMSVGHKTKRHSNGLPVLAPKPVATPPESRASQAGPGRPHAPSVASNTRPTTATPKTASAAKTDETSTDEEKNKVETAEAILQLSRGFKPSRCNTPTDKQLHKDIDQIVKHLQDDESNDSTLVIKSEPASPAPSQDSPRDSPVPPPTSATAPATTPLPPALPKVNGLTITPIDPVKRKSSTPTSAVADKRPKMDVPAKRPSDTSAGSATPSKMPKVDRIADSIKQKQLLRQQEPAATQLNRPPTPRPLSHKPALNAPKPSSSLAAQPPGGSLPKPQPVKTFPPAQVIPLGPQTAPVLAQPLKATPQSAGKSPAPVALRPNKLPHLLPKPVQTGQRAAPPKPTQQFKPITVQQGKPSSQEPVQQTKPVNIANAPHAKIMNGQPATPASASSNLGQLTKVAGSPQNSAPKSVSFLQAQQGASTGNSQQAKPAGSPLGQQTGTTNNLQGQAKLSSGQQAAPFSNRQGQQAKLTTVQQAKLDTKPVSTQQGKPVTTQPPRPSPPCQQSPSKSASPESPIKSKKPMPDLQRLQRPPSSLTGTTVNGSLSLAEVKEHLAKKGQYSPPLTSPPSQVNRTPPRLVEISQQQRKSAPAVPSYGALDLSSASPRASDHGGSWTPPPSLAQALAKRQQVPIAARPPPSSLSSSSPSPPADELFPDPTVLAQQQALFQHLQQLQNLMQVQAGWAASDRIGVKATAKRK